MRKQKDASMHRRPQNDAAPVIRVFVLTRYESFSTVAAVRLFALILVLWLASVPAKAATPNVVNGIAVIVGDAVITYKDLQLALADELEILERGYAGRPAELEKRFAELQKAKLEEMVENQLVLQEFERAGYMLPESYFQGRINDDIKRYGDRLTLTRTLQAQGITFETYRKRIREREILRAMWQQKVPNEPLISPTKIENYYVEHRDDFRLEDQVRLRMIVLTNAPGVSSTKMAEEIVRKLNEGVPFGELARVYSSGSQAADGGDWGWVEKKVLREDLAKVAFSLQPGEHSGVLETPQGIYIMLVEDKKVSYIRSLSEVRDEIENILRAEETKRLREKWISQLKEKTFVQYF